MSKHNNSLIYLCFDEFSMPFVLEMDNRHYKKSQNYKWSNVECLSAFKSPINYCATICVQNQIRVRPRQIGSRGIGIVKQ